MSGRPGVHCTGKPSAATNSRGAFCPSMGYHFNEIEVMPKRLVPVGAHARFWACVIRMIFGSFSKPVCQILTPSPNDTPSDSPDGSNATDPPKASSTFFSLPLSASQTTVLFAPPPTMVLPSGDQATLTPF